VGARRDLRRAFSGSFGPKRRILDLRPAHGGRASLDEGRTTRDDGGNQDSRGAIAVAGSLRLWALVLFKQRSYQARRAEGAARLDRGVVDGRAEALKHLRG
jgi:hypothetical protein